MQQLISELPAYAFYTLQVVFTTIIFVVAYKLGIFFGSYKKTKQIQKIKKEKNIFYKENRKIWDDEKNSLGLENKMIKEKLEDYRRKISGLGMLNFRGSKKRSDILYSLLMENEILEQILHDQTQKLAVEQRLNVDQRLLDIKKRQRLLTEIFDDKKIKDYVHEVLENKNLTNKRISKNNL